MRIRVVVGLAVAAAVVVAAAALAVRDRDAAVVAALPAGEKLFPALIDRANDVAAATVTRAGETFTVALDDGEWRLPEKGGYPARTETVRQTVIRLAELEIVEPMTTDPERFGRLGLAGADAPDSGGTLVALSDAGGELLAEVLLGNSRDRDHLYVRRPEDNRTWLARSPGGMSVAASPLDWIERTILDLDRERITAVTVVHPDGETVSIARDAENPDRFVLAELPEGRRLRAPHLLSGIASALAPMRIDDVAPAAAIDFAGDEAVVAEYAAGDGLVVTAATVVRDDRVWSRFAAEFDADRAGDDADVEAVAAEAEEINARLSGWAFALPRHRIEQLRPHVAELLQEEQPPAPTLDLAPGQ